MGLTQIKDAIEESADRPVVLVFLQDWLGAAHILNRYIEELAEEFDEQILCYFNREAENIDFLSTEFGIRNVPSTLFFKNGELVDSFSGIQSRSRIEARFRRATLL